MPKEKPPKKPVKPKQKLSQKEKFLTYAKEIGVDEAGEAFERVLGSIIKKKKPKE